MQSPTALSPRKCGQFDRATNVFSGMSSPVNLGAEEAEPKWTGSIPSLFSPRCVRRKGCAVLSANHHHPHSVLRLSSHTHIPPQPGADKRFDTMYPEELDPVPTYAATDPSGAPPEYSPAASASNAPPVYSAADTFGAPTPPPRKRFWSVYNYVVQALWGDDLAPETIELGQL
ncbi:hypothetical protein B0H17DRAFT_1339482 [Mycena rosella]|uniref:Uncharacterized protein n=1 Tax=Mycena rosella TaxID=1033263 RepID=A0AAD7C335_MYCRO|nr:hypothetical protein B0H17DRAFT_1339482 [Mycena rosella]